jgi:enoyl-CoA hydratase
MTETIDSEFFALSHENGVAHLQLNRPERLNTMTPAFFPAVRDAVRLLGDEGATRALVISSTGTSQPAAARRLRRQFGARGDDGARAARLPGVAEEAHRFSALDEARFPIVCAIRAAASVALDSRPRATSASAPTRSSLQDLDRHGR